MRHKRPPLHPQWAAWQPYRGKPGAKMSGRFIGPRRSSTRCATNGRHCTHGGPHGSHLGGTLAPKCRNKLSVPAAHKRPPLHPQWAARPYGGTPGAKVPANVIGTRRSSTRCATSGRHYTHSGPHGSHMGGNLAPICRSFLFRARARIPPGHVIIFVDM
jgi:hypothetical protein